MSSDFFDLTVTSTIAALAAGTQAVAAVVIWKLTRRLTTATESYAGETKRMVDDLAERRREDHQIGCCPPLRICTVPRISRALPL